MDLHETITTHSCVWGPGTIHYILGIIPVSGLYYDGVLQSVTGVILDFSDLYCSYLHKCDAHSSDVQQMSWSSDYQSRADPGFEKEGGAGVSGARPQKISSQFRELLIEFGPKRGGRTPPAPPPPLDPRLTTYILIVRFCTVMVKILPLTVQGSSGSDV